MGLQVTRPIRLAAVAALATALALMMLWIIRSELNRASPRDNDFESPQQLPVKLGLSINEPKAFPGYTLVAAVKSTKTFLIDMQGKVVRTWESEQTPALGACLCENGHLLRTGLLEKAPGSDGPGA